MHQHDRCNNCPRRPRNDGGGLDLKVQTATAFLVVVADVIKILAGI